MTYLTRLKTMNVEALKAVFDDQYPDPDFRGVHVSIEYPVDAMNYPGIWVEYTDASPLVTAGVDHQEFVDDAGDQVPPFSRWKYSGYVSYTVTALTSRERDRLCDELVRIFAFGRRNPVLKRFREAVETNDFIAANMNFDRMEMQGNSAAPGTPWGTDEIIYEKTIQVEIQGEFVSDSETGELLLLSAIPFTMTAVAEAEDGVLPPGDPSGGATSWH